MPTDLHRPQVSAHLYRADIDGLRALAVLSVVFFHARLGPVAGGFVGVDVFFVISGYLINGLLMAEQRRGRLSIAGFYYRRILRIFPALAVVALACTIAAALFLAPADFEAFGRSLAAAGLFSSNMYFDATHVASGYFDDSSQTQLLLHTWSLSVEEQFYIAMPLGLILMRARSEAFVLHVLASVTVLSFLVSLWLVAHRPTDAFYIVVPRAWELLLGALVAVAGRSAPSARWRRELMSASGLAMILAAVFTYSPGTPFPGVAALLPCVGAALVIQSGVGGTSVVGRALSLRPAVALGLISYSLYLWHLPMLVLIRHLCAGSTAPVPTGVALTGSVLAAVLSYRYVETPFRRGRHRPQRVVLAGGAATCVVAVLLGATIVAAAGLPGRFDRAAVQVAAANAERHTDHIKDLCGNYGRPMQEPSDFRVCGFGNEPRKVLVWGDSMAEELQPLLHRLHDEGRLGDHGVLFAVADGCPPAPEAGRPGLLCDVTNRWSIERASRPDVDAILVVFAPWWERHERRLCRIAGDACLERLSAAHAEALVIESLRTTLARLRALGKRVVLGLPVPDYNLDTTKLETQEALAPGITQALRSVGLIRLERLDYRSLRQRLVELAGDLGLGLFDPRRDLCSGDQCTYAEGGISAYVEGQHIALARTSLFHQSLGDALADALAVPREQDLRAESAAEP